jgi:photosynthetic reaction center H subunit
MEKGAITQYIDVAQVVLYFFWVFFFGLIWYLRREDKREGYPLAYERIDTAPYLNFPAIPSPKTFFLPHGGSVQAPRASDPQIDYRAESVAPFIGAPLEPIGDAMLAGAGPGAYALRSDTPDLTLEGLPKIVPLRIATGEKLVTHATQGTEASPPPATSGHYKHYTLHPNDPDPRGMNVIGADKRVAGVVQDVWIDVSEVVIRYLEVTVPGAQDTVLLPMTFASIDKSAGRVHVDAILASQFAQVPRIKTANQVTFLEEEQICAYYGAGTLYATPQRRESLL